ncbi:MAG: hypothetical protein WB988_05230 [Candidatus Nitrosopolaris sp.]|jgi:hypothetical protein
MLLLTRDIVLLVLQRQILAFLPFPEFKAVIDQELGGIASKRPKLALEHAEDYEKKKKIVDNYKKISAALLKKNPPGI